ncbi:A/G-specific adenine glycosylase [Aestuariivirga sp.]|uniref:A/G-specific adenine glycosylase n=1 Tax=Aestuariivirga sp. TaxID=2650926 RepID=UPI0039E2878E
MAEEGLKRRPEKGSVEAVRLLAWYDSHGRDLPWRVKGHHSGERQDPYFVWLSEVMLQQTTVAAVRDYFRKFIALWPTVEALAAADLDDVLRAWAGLGYYARARNLHACAKAVVERHGGRFPASYEALLALPGVGPYTAAAIAAIAFDLRHAAIDGNVERVISRYYAIEQPLPESKPEIRARAEALVPEQRAGDFAQAIMDLGATLCTPKSPNCLICPWTEDCRGRIAGIAAELPRKAAKKTVPTRRGHAYWITRADGAVLLRRRPEKGLLGGMMEIPSSEWLAKLPDEEKSAPVDAAWRRLPGVVTHTFTHFHLELTVWAAEVDNATLPESRFVARRDLHAEALPTVMRKIVAHVLGEA